LNITIATFDKIDQIFRKT